MFAILSYESLFSSKSAYHGTYEWTEPGTYSFILTKPVTASIAMVGGGAAFVGTLKMRAGTYTITVGSAGALVQSTNPDSIKGEDTSMTLGDDRIVKTGGGEVSGGSLIYSDDFHDDWLITATIEGIGKEGFLESSGSGIMPEPPSPYTGGQSLYKGYGKGVGYSNSQVVADNTAGYFYIKW